MDGGEEEGAAFLRTYVGQVVGGRVLLREMFEGAGEGGKGDAGSEGTEVKQEI